MKKSDVFKIQRRICFYETDAMGVVHHSNYLRFFEEVRMHWYNARNLNSVTWPSGHRVTFAVVESSMRHKAPARYNEEIEVRMQAKHEGNRLKFQYAVVSLEEGRVLTVGSTTHVPVDQKMKVCRIPSELQHLLEVEPWTETWP